MQKDFNTLALSRRTVHKFDATRPLPDNCIKDAIEVALRAPNHKLTHPWGFIEIGPETKAEVAEIVLQSKEASAKTPLTPKKRDQIRNTFLAVPTLIVATQRIVGGPERQKEDYAACACGIQNFSLSLWEKGIGSKWSTPLAIDEQSLYDLLELDRDAYTIIGFLLVGYPESVTDTLRPSFDEVYRKTK